MIQKTIKKIVTDTTPLEEPKDYESCNIYALAKLFLDQNELQALQERYKTPGEGYGHFKLYLHDVMWEYFRPYREKREYYAAHQDEVREILKAGADKARSIAQEKMEIIRSKTGITY